MGLDKKVMEEIRLYSNIVNLSELLSNRKRETTLTKEDEICLLLLYAKELCCPNINYVSSLFLRNGTLVSYATISRFFRQCSNIVNSLNYSFWKVTYKF